MQFIQADTIIPSAHNPKSYNRYAYVKGNPIKFNDPSGHWECEETPHERPRRLKIPKAVDPKSWEELVDDPIELIARALLSEEGVKLFTPLELDVYGVAWAIRNRYRYQFNNYEFVMTHYGPSFDRDRAWEFAAASMIHGMRSGLAKDPMNNWSQWGIFGSQDEMLEAYNRALEIAEEVLSMDQSEDITNGAIRWSDGYCDGGTCEYDENGYVTNLIPYLHTHFSDSYNTYKPNWCVNGVGPNECNKPSSMTNMN